MTRHRRIIKDLFTLAQDIEPVAAARVAAMITINNREVGFGFNSRKTDPFQKKFGRNSDAICLHAEIMAIKNSIKRIDREDFKNATIYIARAKKCQKTKKFIYGLAKPCPGCMRAISAFNFKRVVYTCDGGEINIM